MKRILVLIALVLTYVSVSSQETAATLYTKALEQKKQLNCAEVLILLDKALELKPDFGEALLEKGWCLNELKRPAEALATLYKASVLLKNNFMVSYELGLAHYYLNKIDSAEYYFNTSVQIKKNNLPASVGLGDLYREKKENTRKALNWYLKAAEADSTHKKNNYWIGWCYNDLKKYDSAILYLQKVLMEEPSNILASVELGYALYSLNKYSESIAAFKTVLQSSTKSQVAIFYTGMCLAKTGDKAGALDRYNELVILKSQYAAALLAEIQKMK